MKKCLCFLAWHLRFFRLIYNLLTTKEKTALLFIDKKVPETCADCLENTLNYIAKCPAANYFGH